MSHAGLALILAIAFYRRRRLVRRRPNLHRLIYRYLLPALALAWMTAFLAERETGRTLFLNLAEPLIVVSLGLALSSRYWEAGPVDLNAPPSSRGRPSPTHRACWGLLARLKDEGARVWGP
jgi:hypothetical protein